MRDSDRALRQFTHCLMIFPDRDDLQRDDILVPDDELDLAASALLTNGWITSTSPLPTSREGLRSGWQVVAKFGRQLRHPDKYNTETIEMLLLPTTFVGLDSNPALISPDFTLTMDNIWCPSAHLLAVTIVRTCILRTPQNSAFSSRLNSWHSYFYQYAGFTTRSMDAEDDEVRDWWHSRAQMMFGTDWQRLSL